MADERWIEVVLPRLMTSHAGIMRRLRYVQEVRSFFVLYNVIADHHFWSCMCPTCLEFYGPLEELPKSCWITGEEVRWK